MANETYGKFLYGLRDLKVTNGYKGVYFNGSERTSQRLISS